MAATQPPAVRPLTQGVSALLAVFGALTLLAVVVLYVFAGRTDRLFAWTIEPPLTAAFLGGGYGAGCVLVLLGRREGDWVKTRIPFLTILLFVVLTLAATVLHLDRFHFGAARPLPRFAAWFWLAIYVGVPAAMGLSLLGQRRVPGSGRRPRRPLPRWLRLVLGLQGGVLVLVGAVLFAAPRAAGPAWPWTLTPLTARTVAAWLVALGVAAALAVRADDLARLRVAAVTYATLGALQLVAVVRYAAQLQWEEPSAWAYAAMAVGVLLTGLYGWRVARRA